eukprot:1146539-Pelagomonas_calceolata.AAC.4
MPGRFGAIRNSIEASRVCKQGRLYASLSGAVFSWIPHLTLLLPLTYEVQSLLTHFMPSMCSLPIVGVVMMPPMRYNSFTENSSCVCCLPGASPLDVQHKHLCPYALRLPCAGAGVRTQPQGDCQDSSLCQGLCPQRGQAGTLRQG